MNPVYFSLFEFSLDHSLPFRIAWPAVFLSSQLMLIRLEFKKLGKKECYLLPEAKLSFATLKLIRSPMVKKGVFTNDNWRGKFKHHPSKVHGPNTVSVGSFKPSPQGPVRSHHCQSAGYLRVEYAKSPILPEPWDGGLVERYPSRRYHDYLQQKTRQQRY